MRLTIVGCAGSYPNGGGAASCYLIEHDGFRLLVDLGSGALGPLHTHVDPLAIDGILLSHLHADHFLDICPMFVVRRYGPTGIAPVIPVYAPAGAAERIAAAYGNSAEELAEVFDVREMPADAAFSLGPITVTATQVDHPVVAYALRLEAAGRVLTYSGDTAACEALVSAARGAHLALFEASFRDCDDNPPFLHMSARDAAQSAVAAGAERLVLTHMVAWHDNSGALEEAAVFGGEVLIAAPGMVLEV